LRKELGDQTALIGFSGSPWTLATFMMEGGSAEKFTKAKALFDSDKQTFSALMEKLTAAVTAYLQMQIAAGVDALQIFDSHGGHLPAADFQEASGRLDARHHHQSALASSGDRVFARHAWQLERPCRHRCERAGH
jgi:uroporphyrinogen decarboxylase